MKKLNQKGFGIVEGLIIIVSAFLLGFIGWYIFDKSQSKTKLSNSELISAVKEKISKHTNVREVGAEDGAYNAYVSFKVDGYDFMSTVESKDAINYQLKDSKYLEVENESEEANAKLYDSGAIQPVIDSITKIVEENGFERVEGYPVADFFSSGAMYERENDVCAVNTDAPNTGLSCASKSELKDVAEEVKPFVEIFNKQKDSKQPGTAFGLVETRTGKTKKDKLAVVSVGYGAAYFYQKDGEWVYLATTQEGIGCDEFPNNQAATDAIANHCRTTGEGL